MGAIWTYDYTIEPPQPNGFEEVRVRLDSPSGCATAYVYATADIPNRTLRFVVSGEDFGYPQCPAEWVTPMYRSFGVLPRRTYTIELVGCTPAPFPGHPPCDLINTEQLFVGGGDPVGVPTMGEVGIATLVLMLLAFAQVRLRTNR